ncbi:MAG: hypothetical protein WD552_03095 [Candidatus Paceibacterota bacterium]
MRIKLKKSQVRRILKTAGQLLLLLVFFVLVGFILPIRIAPGVADFLSITTPYEAAREVMSVRIQNRNLTSGGTFTVGVSDPASSVRVTSLSYSCQFSEITLAYSVGADIKRIPCDTALTLPQASQHRVMVFTEKTTVTYLPVELVLESEDRVGSISIVVAVAAGNVDEQSRLLDSSTATLKSFPARD